MFPELPWIDPCQAPFALLPMHHIVPWRSSSPLRRCRGRRRSYPISSPSWRSHRRRLQAEQRGSWPRAGRAGLGSHLVGAQACRIWPSTGSISNQPPQSCQELRMPTSLLPVPPPRGCALSPSELHSCAAALPEPSRLASPLSGVLDSPWQGAPVSCSYDRPSCHCRRCWCHRCQLN